MNILGIGGFELVLILIIMLMVAGPKRMIHWAYIMGKWVAKFRIMWSQTVDMVQKEINAAGYDVELPKDPPTRANLTRWAQNAVKPDDPLRKAVDEIKGDIDQLDRDMSGKAEVKKPPRRPIREGAVASGSMTGATANGASKPASSNGSAASPPVGGADFGSWSQPPTDPTSDTQDKP